MSAPRKTIEFVVPTSTRPTTCRSCGARCAWISTDRGKKMLVSLATARQDELGRTLAQSHFADCADADKWRKGR